MGFSAPFDCLGTRSVQSEFMTVDDSHEIRPNAIKVELLGLDGFGSSDLAWLDKDQRVAFEDSVADDGGDQTNSTADVCTNHVLHFHGFDDQQLLADAHLFAFAYFQTYDRALERRCDWNRVLRALRRSGPYSANRKTLSCRAPEALAQVQHGQ